MKADDVPATAAAVSGEVGDLNEQARAGRDVLARTPHPAREVEPTPGWRAVDRTVDGVLVLPTPWLNLHVEDVLAVGPALGTLFRWYQGTPSTDGTSTFTEDEFWYLYLHDVTGSSPGDRLIWDGIAGAFGRHLDAAGTWRERFSSPAGPGVRLVRFAPG